MLCCTKSKKNIVDSFFKQKKRILSINKAMILYMFVCLFIAKLNVFCLGSWAYL